MPRAQFEGRFLHAGLPAMAAAYLFQLCKNHAFMDGNKRTALATAEVFLLINDMRLTASNEAIEKLTIGVADGSINKKDVTAFFQENTEPNSPSI
jgi:death-on-curing protein